MAAQGQLGSKLGPRIAHLVSQAVIAAHAQGTGHRVETAHTAARHILKGLAAEAGPSRNPLLEKLATNPNTPPDYAEMLGHWTGTPDWQVVVSSISAVIGALGAAAKVGQNELQPTVDDLMSHAPNQRFDVGTSARLMQMGIMPASDARAEGAAQGFDSWRVDAIAESILTAPGLAQILELLNRGEISTGDAEQMLERLLVKPEYRSRLLSLRENLLPPALLADAVLRGWLTQEEGAAEAGRQGISAARFQTMVDDTGEPPGLMQLLEAYRRGFIDKARLVHGIRESRVRDEWADVVEKLRYQPPSAAEAIEGAVKGHLSESAARSKAEIAGLDPAEFDWRLATTGNPPGAQEMLSLLNRGEASEAEVIAALKQGHLADRFIPEVLKLRRKLIPESVLMLAQQSGTLEHDAVIAALLDLGYTAADAATLAATGSRAKISADWSLGKQITVDQYQLGYISAQDATSYLLTVGYDESEAASILKVADLARALAAQTSAVTKVKGLYISHEIDAAAAQAALTALHVPAEQTATIMTEWGLERDANARHLTPAEIATAVYYQVLTQEQGQAALEHLGYSAEDAWVLISIRSHGPLPNEPGGVA